MTCCSCGQGIKDMNGSRVIEDADASGVPEPMDTGSSKILTENRGSRPRNESKWPAWRCFGWRQWGISLIPARCGGNHGDHKVEGRSHKLQPLREDGEISTRQERPKTTQRVEGEKATVSKLNFPVIHQSFSVERRDNHMRRQALITMTAGKEEINI
jgi:hypothetical protein